MPQPTAPAEGPSVSDQVEGVCHVVFAFDVGVAIDLDAARRVLTPKLVPPHDARATPRYFEYHPEPVRTTHPRAGMLRPLAGFDVEPDVDATLFDFGAVSITFRVPLRCSEESLLELATELYDHRPLLEEAALRARTLITELGPAITKPLMGPHVEDYAIFALKPIDGSRPASWLADRRPMIARILRAEPRMLSSQEMHDALACEIAYGERDLVLIDWNASLVMQEDPTDIVSVLEFANVELLEMRHLDDQLDVALDEAYRVVQRGRRSIAGFLGAGGPSLRRVSQMQMDAALLFEGVNNALKLMGDQYLARVYRLAAQRLHLPEWDTAILRKLDTLGDIYDKISDRESNRRMEALEWIIIALIAFEIAFSLYKL